MHRHSQSNRRRQSLQALSQQLDESGSPSPTRSPQPTVRPVITRPDWASIRARNSAGSATTAQTLTIKPPPPVIKRSLTATGRVGVAFSYTITATNSPTSYNATGLPAGLSVNTSTGVISGTPTTA